MTTPQTYKLEIHIDSQQITKESLEEKVNAILQKYLTEGSISLQINTPHDFYYQLVVNGDLQSVDACHYEIHKDIIKKEDLKFYRYTDEAGDEIRYRVYPILADIEQRFRAFINKALAEILGFDWWVDSVPEKINKVTNNRYSNSRKDQIAPHYLECTDFDNLIKLITIDYCKFQDDLSFTHKDFDQLLQNCQSFDDLKLKWNQKKKVLSYWEIFSKYFNDRKQWDDLKKELEPFVINVRNKVMHHRPIRFCVIKKLDEIKEELIKVFDSAKPELSEEERIEAQQEIQEIKVTKERNPIDLSLFREYMQEKDFKSLQKLMETGYQSLGYSSHLHAKDLLLNIRNPIISEPPKPMAPLSVPGITENIKTGHLHAINQDILLNIRDRIIPELPKPIIPLNKLQQTYPQSISKLSQASSYSKDKKSIIKTEKSVENGTDSGLLDESIEQENKCHDANSNEDNIIADENELDQNS